MEEKILYSFNYTESEEPKSLQEVADFLKIDIQHMDEEFGFVSIDPVDRLFCVLVDPSQIPSAEGGSAHANARIDHFGHEEE